MKKFVLGCLSAFSILALTACGIGFGAPKKVTIDGVTYCNGFYEDLSPVFGEVGDIGSETLQKEILYDNRKREFRRVSFEGHDWVHSNTGGTTNGTVYCEESQWEQEHEYYSNSNNFFYFGVRGLKFGDNNPVTDIDPEKFDELLSFAAKNRYRPFGSNKNAETRILPIPDMEESPRLTFFRKSKDGYFTSYKGDNYHIIDGKLLLVFQYVSGEHKQLEAVDVPDELGLYFMDLIMQH